MPAWAMTGPVSMPKLGLANWPRTWKGAITCTRRGFLGWPLMVRFTVSVSRFTVPWPAATTTPVSNTMRRAVITPPLTSNSATAQRRSVCLGSLASSWNSPGTRSTPISSARAWRTLPAGMATATRPSEAAAARCTELPAPCRTARPSITPSMGTIPWGRGMTSCSGTSVMATSTSVMGVALRASSLTRPPTWPRGREMVKGSSFSTPWSSVRCSATLRRGTGRATTDSAR